MNTDPLLLDHGSPLEHRLNLGQVRQKKGNLLF